MIKAIIFDCFGVLTESRLRAFVSNLSPHDRPIFKDLHRAQDLGFISYQEFKREAIKLNGVDADKFDEQFLYRTTYPKNTVLLSYIKTLSKKYKISLLSNVGTTWVRDDFLNSAERNLFDDFVLSCEVGLAKPDPKIFRLACQRLKTEPNESVMVDDIEGYCQAAKDTGLRAVQYKEFAQFKLDLEKLLSDPNN